jgi:selenocysteine-specific elongation factor
MRVIGTAGHVDHGKSTLIAALTGTHPDRLKEEQAREMTIELGFGWLTLPNGEEIGIVDVPGHRDFIENMLAGIGGIDAALLIIAADEGVMPQTKEHLAILDLLEIPTGLIVLTKCDLASDPGWLDLLEADIRRIVSDTVLRDAPIVQVSAKTKTGLETLVANLQSLLEAKPSRPDLSRPRLPIDRIFTMSGFGTVITGTLSDGKLTVGDEIEILPHGLKGRIRGLQTHKKKEELAVPGSRTAVNITGVELESIRRGDVLARPGQYQTTRRIDARLRMLKDATIDLKHNDEVKFFSGASETLATVRLLGRENLPPGEEGWIQLELRDPAVAVRGDRFILRRPSPGETLGGGKVVDHQPKGRHKRFDEAVLRSLDSLAQGSPADIVLEAAAGLGIATIKEIVSRSRLDANAAKDALAELLRANSLIFLEERSSTSDQQILVSTIQQWNSIRDQITQMVGEHHRQFPLRRGIPREELKSKLKLSPRVFNLLLAQYAIRHIVTDHSVFVSLPEHSIRFTAGEQAAIEGLRRLFAANPYSPPGVKECQSVVGEEVLNALVESGELIPVSADVIFRKSDYDSIQARIKHTIETHGKISLAEARDQFNTSRKYAQALLEHFDSIGFTVRDGDFRKLRK